MNPGNYGPGDLQSPTEWFHSAALCLLYLTDLIRKEVSFSRFAGKRLCGVVSLDLPKAFNTAEHGVRLLISPGDGYHSSLDNPLHV